MSGSSVAYINSFSWLGSRPGLERMTELLGRMGDPQKNLRFIHLAGTNGKGSTACFLACMLQAAGYRTGLHISPYLHTFHERMQIDGSPIPDGALDRAVARLRPHAEAMAEHPTTFELVTAAALSWFDEAGCDIVVMEAGMGGALDATNVIDCPEAAVLTPIDLDHMDYLGGTVAEIAGTKAGIIKPGGLVVSAPQHPEAMAEIRRAARDQGATLTTVDTAALVPGAFGRSGQRFRFGKLEDLEIRLLGRYQMENAALALTVLDVLEARGYFVPESARREGLRLARWPGRFELAARGPDTIVDGGHNRQGALALAENLRRYYPGRRVSLVMGLLQDKDVAGILEAVLPLAERVFTITPESPRALPARSLAALIAGRGVPAGAADSVAEALALARSAAGEGGVACYFGSLYSVGAAREALGLYS